MPLSDIVNVVLTATTTSPTRPGFGEPLIAAFVSASIIPGRTAEYGSLSEMVTAGFTTADPAYLCASKIASQNPRPRAWKVGRRSHSFTQKIQLTCNAGGFPSTQSYVFKVGSTTFTVPGTGSANGDAAAITTAVASTVTNCVATNPSSPSPNVLLTMTAGKLVEVAPDTAKMTLADTTTDAGGSSGIADDLAAILAVDGNWYGLLLDSNSPAEISAAAAWTEANGPRLFVTNASDSAIAVSSSTTDVAYTLKTSAYARTVLLFSQTSVLSYSGAAWMGNRFPYSPGSDTWAFKTLAGVAADNLNDGQVHAVENKNANVYTPLAGVNVTQFGKCPSGTFADLTRGIDWFTSELQINIYGLLINNQKVPFTDAGIDMIRSTVLGVIQEGIDAGLLAEKPTPIVTLPAAAAVNSIDKAARNLPNVFIQATLAGAIHTLTVTGTLSV